MATRYFKSLLPLLLLLLLSGCNSEIFVDDSPPSDEWVDISVGQPKQVSFATDNLRTIQLQLNRFRYDWTRYDDDGYSQVYRDRQSLYLMDVSSSLPFIRRVVAICEDVEIEFVQDSFGRLTLKVLKNQSRLTVSGCIKLGYSYKDATINFVIEAEREDGAYQISGLSYNKDVAISNSFTTAETTPLTIVNNGSAETLSESFCPESWCQIMVRFEVRNLSAYDLDPDQEYPELEIPTYVYNPTETVVRGAFNGTCVKFSPDLIYMKPLDSASVNGLSFYAVYPVSIPPKSTVKGVMTLSRIKMEAPATLHLHNPVSGHSRDLPTTVSVIQPFFYTFHWEDATKNEN